MKRKLSIWLCLTCYASFKLRFIQCMLCLSKEPKKAFFHKKKHRKEKNEERQILYKKKKRAKKRENQIEKRKE